MDTIYALASAPGKAGVAVVRISGPRAHEVGGALSGRSLPERGMSVTNLSAMDGRELDQALVLTFAGPASFTGEDVCELHLHGSAAVVAAVLDELRQQDGLRMADAGEFTRRALENGKLDLAQVEGLADLIDSETEAQRRQAQRLLAGELGRLAEGWRHKLIRAASLIEATIDFADEEVPQDVRPEVDALLNDVVSELKDQTRGVLMAERIRSGFEVAIIGPPNVGKSTLLNALAGRDAAITSEIAGTTRDVIEVRMDLSGYPVTFLDTAGLRISDDVVERIGIDRAMSRAEAADLRIFLAEDPAKLGVKVQESDIQVRPKGDLLSDPRGAVSGKTGAGLDDLIKRIEREFSSRAASVGLATRVRQKDAMDRAISAIDEAIHVLVSGPDRYDMAAEDLRTAIRALESLVGRIDVETLLDEIFSSFCIGK